MPMVRNVVDSGVLLKGEESGNRSNGVRSVGRSSEKIAVVNKSQNDD